MDIDQIEALVSLVSRSTVAEVSVRTEDRRVTVRRSAAPRGVGRPATRSASERSVPELSAASEGKGDSAQTEGLIWVTAPLVGIFFHAEPPVTVGVEIVPGQVIGVVESMKLMNEVRSEQGGVVVESAIEAGMAVEFGQPLFAIRRPEQETEDGTTD
jgi:acetyl-CoA carboxylase biotin carboxyl carrier protein